MKVHSDVRDAVPASENGLHVAMGRLALEQADSADPAVLRGWNKSVQGSHKVVWSGACSACGILTSVPFKPLIGRNPPMCRSCFSGQGQGQGQGPRSGLASRSSFVHSTGQEPLRSKRGHGQGTRARDDAVGTQPTPERTTRLCVDALNFPSAAQFPFAIGIDSCEGSCAGSQCTRYWKRSPLDKVLCAERQILRAF